ncbi:helix-turn-helix domain-containing protein [Aquirufa ecclesiirivi]|uniref:helix-turn-helix domain-containing protein n=1 Tax=Aquirufa ecclesiirivi TaxID=2715124 RepID=UPI0023D816A3|nr:AraC family transcriptional regulator [Aquirufa ecclesiirivi]MDF0694701.1 AraC family transcriptional regulator [Aquirufa ecclesiirivi]
MNHAMDGMLIFLVLFKLVVSLVLAVFNFRVNRNTIYLSGVLVVIALFGLLHYSLFASDSPTMLVFMGIYSIPTYYLVGPFLYFYFRSTLLDNSKIYRSDYLHYLPFLIALINVFPSFLHPWKETLELANQILADPNYLKTLNLGWIYPSTFNMIGRPICMLIYIGLIFKMYREHSNELYRNALPDSHRILMKKWLILLLIVVTFAALSYLAGALVFMNTPHVPKQTVMHSPLTLIVMISFLMIPLLIVIFPQVLYGIPIVKKKRKSFDHFLNASEIYKYVNKSDDPLREDALRILDSIHEEKWYLDPEFNVDILASKLDLPKHHIYYCFNYIIKSKFTTLRSQLRIEYAKNLLKSEEELDIELIALQSGYSSVQSFNRAFVEDEGLNVFEYISKIKRK